MKEKMIKLMRLATLIGAFFIGAISFLNAQTHQERVTIEGAFQPSIRDFEKQFVMPQTPENSFPPPDTTISRLERVIGHRA